jgi:hypothetical protein
VVACRRGSKLSVVKPVGVPLTTDVNPANRIVGVNSGALPAGMYV